VSDADLPREPVRRVDEPAPFVQHQALPEHPAPTPGSDAPPSVSLEMIQDNEALAAFIASADRVMEAMGFTEHGFRHANLVSSISFQVAPVTSSLVNTRAVECEPITSGTWMNGWPR